jgi:GntR family transcriptional regulator
MLKSVSNPRYQVLANELRQRIAGGDYKPGDRLPSESQLCVEYGVSRGTVVRAIEQLVIAGIVHRRQGDGSFVARPSLHRHPGNLLSFSESAASEGHRSSQTLLSVGEASAEQVREFQCDGPAVFLQRLRQIDGLPCAVHRSIIPMHVASQIEALNGTDPGALECGNFSLYEALDAAGFTVREAHERVTTRLASREECDLLNIEEPAPVMVVFRRSHGVSGRLVEAVEAVYHGGYYTYDMHLIAAPSPVSPHAEPNVLSLGGRVTKSKNRE